MPAEPGDQSALHAAVSVPRAERTPTVGVVGMGSLGGQIITGLVNAGLAPTAGCDAVTGLSMSRAVPTMQLCDDPATAADLCDVVFVAVFDEDQVRVVLAGDRGIIHTSRRPVTVVLVSTVTLDFIGWADDVLRAVGIGLVDCGANGAPGIATGQMVASVGGTAEAFDLVRPVLGLIADPVVHMGPVGSGMSAKLVRNMVVYATWYAATQGAALAVAAGLDVSKIVEVVDAAERWASGSTWLVRQAMARAQASDGDDGAGIVAYAHKDLAAALALGDRAGLDLPVMRSVADDYASVTRLPTSP